jgi:DNA-binding NtrC family response regulator
LNVLKIDILPLRERREDIELIANYFLSKLKKYQNKNGADKFSPKFINYLYEYNWNGNVRELQNIIERAYYLCDESIITEKYLYGNIIKQDAMNLEVVSLENAERGNIIKMIIECSGNVVEAGGKLNLSKSTIYRKIKKHNIKLNLIF